MNNSKISYKSKLIIKQKYYYFLLFCKMSSFKSLLCTPKYIRSMIIKLFSEIFSVRERNVFQSIVKSKGKKRNVLSSYKTYIKNKVFVDKRDDESKDEYVKRIAFLLVEDYCSAGEDNYIEFDFDVEDVVSKRGYSDEEISKVKELYSKSKVLFATVYIPNINNSIVDEILKMAGIYYIPDYFINNKIEYMNMLLTKEDIDKYRKEILG